MEISSILFALELSLLFTHEMDAVKRKEWKMFIGLNKIDNEKACQIFVLLHIPLYAAILWLLQSPYQQIGFYITDIFLIIHMLVHLGFSKHPANNFKNKTSKAVIFLSGLLACGHVVRMLLFV